MCIITTYITTIKETTTWGQNPKDTKQEIKKEMASKSSNLILYYHNCTHWIPPSNLEASGMMERQEKMAHITETFSARGKKTTVGGHNLQHSREINIQNHIAWSLTILNKGSKSHKHCFRYGQTRTVNWSGHH